MNKNPIKTIQENLPPITSQNIIDSLNLTIKYDDCNKLTTFLCCLSAYTFNSQLNLSFNAPSSTGKSYIALEVAKLFPSEDLLKLGSSSPTAFFHEQGEYDKENNIMTVDLSSKIIIFLDQPNSYLLERLRPLLSHDQKEIIYKTTDKKEKGGLYTKTVKLIGYPAFIFCSASLKLDEQENTRFILLSPETSDRKILEAIHSKIDKESDTKGYLEMLKSNKDRQRLKDRIIAIKKANIKEIIINQPDVIEEMFLAQNINPKPRHQRDIARLLAIVKIFSLLNFPYRQPHKNKIFSNEEDIHSAFELWNMLSVSQEYGIPPYMLQLLEEIIIPRYLANNPDYPKQDYGISRQEITQEHYKIYKRPIAEFKLRTEILPMLENAGLIMQKPDPHDKRKILTHPVI